MRDRGQRIEGRQGAGSSCRVDERRTHRCRYVKEHEGEKLKIQNKGVCFCSLLLIEHLKHSHILMLQKKYISWLMGNPVSFRCGKHAIYTVAFALQHFSVLCVGLCASLCVCGICDLLLPQICFSIVPKTLIRTSQMSRLHICNSKLARSMVNVITLFVIPRFEFHNECVQKRRREEKKTGKMSDFSQNQCLSTALRSFLTGKGIHTHLAAIVSSKMTNHNIIDVLKKKTTTDDRTIDNLCSHPERKS